MSNDNESPDSSSSGSLWDDDNALSDLTMERSLHPEETDNELTRRLMAEAGPHAARTIINLATHAINENTRLNAAKFVAEWAREEGAVIAGASWEELLQGTIKMAEQAANGES